MADKEFVNEGGPVWASVGWASQRATLAHRLCTVVSVDRAQEVGVLLEAAQLRLNLRALQIVDLAAQRRHA